MKRRIIAFAAAAALGITSTWASGYRQMIIDKFSGEPETISISPELTTTFTDGNMVLASGDNTTEIPMTDVKSWSYAPGTVDGISDALLTSDIVVEPGRVVLGNLPAGTTVAITAVDGRTVARTAAEGTHVVALDALQPGVYVISYNNHSLKISVSR